MLFTTEGIFLKKEIYRKYDEVVHLLTRDYGKITLISFGSRSLRSRKRYFLASLFWLNIEIEVRGGLNILKELQAVKKINFGGSGYLDFIAFGDLLKSATTLMIKSVPDEEVYELLKFLSRDFIAPLNLDFKKFLYPFALLKEWNAIENFQSCAVCRSICSQQFVFRNDQFMGYECLEKKNPQETLLTLNSLFFYKYFYNAYGKDFKIINHFYRHYQDKFLSNSAEWQTLVKLMNYFLNRYVAINA